MTDSLQKLLATARYAEKTWLDSAPEIAQEFGYIADRIDALLAEREPVAESEAASEPTVWRNGEARNEDIGHE